MATSAHMGEARRGLLLGLGAYLIWGVVPLYFRLLRDVPPVETVAHRVCWSVLLLFGILLARRRLDAITAVVRQPRVLAALALSAALIFANWLVYIWAVVNDHLVQASLGYFLNPLLNVALGLAVLKERLNRGQAVAVALAVVGVTILVVASADGLWVSLVLAGSFGLYGLIRKLVPVGALDGLAVETALLAPMCLGFLLWANARGTLYWGTDHGVDALLIASAFVTSVPLLMFAAAVRRVPYAVVGLLQYLSPSLVLLQGVFLFGEPVSTAKWVCFALIWAGLAIVSGGELAKLRRRSVPA